MGKHRGEERPSADVSWFEGIWDLWRDWTYNLPLIGAFVVGSTVLVGVPVGLFADDQSFPSGLVIGALLGLAVFGLISCGLVFVGVLAIVADVVRWLVARVRPKARDREDPPQAG